MIGGLAWSGASMGAIGGLAGEDTVAPGVADEDRRNIGGPAGWKGMRLDMATPARIQLIYIQFVTSHEFFQGMKK